jgi:hypothetical protein
VNAAMEHTQAVACFAEGRPLISLSQRGQVDGSPDWVDKTKKATLAGHDIQRVGGATTGAARWGQLLLHGGSQAEGSA